MVFIGLQDNHICFRSLATYIRMEVQIRSTIAPFIFFTSPEIECFVAIMAGDTSSIQYRLNFQVKGERTDTSFRKGQLPRCSLRGDHPFGNRYLILVSMT